MYSPRHARPSCLPARAAAGTTLTAVLLPLVLAGPAFAQESATPTATIGSSPEPTPSAEPMRAQTTMRISATTVGDDGRSSIGVRLLADDRAVPDALVDVEARTGSTWSSVAQLRTNAQGLAVGSLPFSESTRIRATHSGSATRTSGTSPEIVVVRKQVTAMRISATQAGADGRSRIGVRLLADGRAVQNGYIRLEAATGSGWQYIGRLLSNAEGLGQGSLPFDRDTRIRATYAGSSTRTPGASPEIVVKATTLGRRAVQIAAEQQGKPYRYGSTGPSSFDCSGFTTYIFKTRLGKSIPRTSAQQEASIPRVAQSAKRPGDLLFFRSGGRVSHVGVYAGSGRMWAAPTTGDRVKLQAIYSSSYTVGRVS
ncbi:MAG: C40 family peptidase [Mycobacteriales bacterium]